MSGYTRWKDVRASYVERVGGGEAVQADKEELLAPVRSGSSAATPTISHLHHPGSHERVNA